MGYYQTKRRKTTYKSDSRYDVLHGKKRDNHLYLLIMFIIFFLIRRASAVMGYFQTKRGKTTYIWLQFSPESGGITARAEWQSVGHPKSQFSKPVLV